VVEREVLSRFAASDTMLSNYSHYYAAALSEAKEMAVKGADAETMDALMRKTFEAIKNKAAPETEKALIIVKPAPEVKPAEAVEPIPPAQEPKPKKTREKKKPTPPVEEPPVPKVQRKTLGEYLGDRS
jgi:outer membrane biosynthesis protein TonB